jgi:hypothetical protein
MGELKSCLFCGKNVDQAFEYCPHCGYEFGQDDDRSSLGNDQLPAGADLPGLIEETSVECPGEGEKDYLLRLRTLQEILADMERELDLIIAMDGEVGRGQGRPKGRT